MSGTAAASADVLVIGASIGGLAAAGCLARAGRKVVVLEARDNPGGLAEPRGPGDGIAVPHTLYALDPVLVKVLRLTRHGLGFAVRDMALAGLRPGGRQLVLTRDVHATSRALQPWSRADAEAWPAVQDRLRRLARAMRPLWWEDGDASDRLERQLGPRLGPLAAMGAAAFLDAAFESDALKATLAFDATAGGLSPLEPGSALALLWRQAQEMCGLQGAVAVPKGGMPALTTALAAAAREAGAEIRCAAAVRHIETAGGAARGVELKSGERLGARFVLSSLSRHRTQCTLLEPASVGFAAAQREDARPQLAAARILLRVRSASAFGVPSAARFIVAERLEAYAAAAAAARAGHLPDEPPLEITLPAPADPAPGSEALVSVLVRPVPAQPLEGWAKASGTLVERVTALIARVAPALVAEARCAEIVTPEMVANRYAHEDGGADAAHLLAGWPARIATPVKGLMLCGAAAEPVPALSGRAGRIAAGLVLKELSK